jgi:hypothetical protein
MLCLKAHRKIQKREGMWVQKLKLSCCRAEREQVTSLAVLVSMANANPHRHWDDFSIKASCISMNVRSLRFAFFVLSPTLTSLSLPAGAWAFLSSLVLVHIQNIHMTYSLSLSHQNLHIIFVIVVS